MRYKDVQVTVHLSVANGASERAKAILSHMVQHCDSATLASTASEFGCHPNTIASTVRLSLGMTFHEALVEIRMQRAAQLLDEGVDVAQAARCCGYDCPDRFRGAFGQRWGCPPREWAERSLAKNTA